MNCRRVRTAATLYLDACLGAPVAMVSSSRVLTSSVLQECSHNLHRAVIEPQRSSCMIGGKDV